MTTATPLFNHPSPPEFSTDPAVLFPHIGPWTEAEYLALDTNRLVEFSDGELKVIEMATESQQDIVAAFYEALVQFVRPLKLGKVLFAARQVKLWEGKFREPDVLFMLAEHDARRNEQFWEGADLVMEVVSSDRRHDLVTKKFEYARTGIPEYWIVDPELKEITVLKLGADGYETAGVYHRGDLAKSVLLPGFSVDVSAIFDAK